MAKVNAVRFEYRDHRWEVYSTQTKDLRLAFMGSFRWDEDENYWYFNTAYLFIYDEWKEIMKFWKTLNKEKGI